MGYDATKPADNSPLSSLEMRNQFNGLKSQIDQKVSTATMNATIGQASANNVDALQPLNWTASSDPPSSDDVQAVVDKLNELIAALKH